MASILAITVNCQVYADTAKTEPTKAEKEAAAIVATAQAQKDAQTEKEARARLTAALAPMIEQTQESMEKALGTVRSDLAGDLELKTNKLLAEPEVLTALVNMAYQRRKMDDEPRDDSFYVAEALSSMNGSLRLTPGVMGDSALINRARLLSQVAAYYSSKQPQMCRYIPADFSILMSIDAPWLVGVEPDVFHQALDDEYTAIKLMMSGVLPRNSNDSDKQLAISKFAGHWLGSLSDEDRYQIASAKQGGNYCELWRVLLKDMARMGDSVPDTSRKLISPFMLSMTRGWLDSGLWSYEVDGNSAGK
jgi:hypothetical protein